MNCVCGGNKFQEEQRGFYEVTEKGVTRLAKGKLPVAICSECGQIRRPGQEDSEQYKRFYQQYQPCSEKYDAKTYQHDRGLAVKRCDTYDLGGLADVTLLDIGSGSGAFVDECRVRGIQAFGCEVAEYAYAESNTFIYKGLFNEINFPTDHFDIVTCHDVLEHVLDPVAFVAEAFRVLKQGGQFIIDFPDFFNESGKHHWKVEHIWYFTPSRLKRLLDDVGLVVEKLDHPIDSKIVFYCNKPKQDRPSILLPPGLGDSFWSITKLQAFLKREKLVLPDVFIACNREKKFDGHKRAFPFLEMFPFLNCSGESLGDKGDPELRNIWKEGYGHQGRTIFKNVLGCDYFISYNGWLRVGAHMEECDPDLKTDWHPPMFVSLEQERYKEHCQNSYGKYIVFYFIFQGTYIYWQNEFSINKIANYIKDLCKATDCTPVFAGAKWDAEERTARQLKQLIPGAIDLAGKTSVQQLFGLIRGAELVSGFPSGLTIMAATLRAKTLIIWNQFYNRQFFWNACPPDTRNVNYFIEDTKGLDHVALARMSADIIERGKPRGNPRSLLPTPSVPNLTKGWKPTPLPQERPQLPSRRIVENRVAKPEPPPQTKLDLILNKGKLTVVCVLKTGGEYTRKYSMIMQNMVERNTTIKHDFLVLTDANLVHQKQLRLARNYPGWWSKLELFRLKGPVLYLDLDTVIVGNIDRLAKAVMALPENSFRMLTPFNEGRASKGEWASGILAWNGDFRFLLDNIPASKTDSFFKGWDQVYIFKKLQQHGITIDSINRHAKIYSYRRHCVDGLPKNAEIVCFHGNNRPHSTNNVDWVNQNWR